MQVIKSPKVYPVIVIGSGAAGGMAAWNLTQKGVQVLMLDAGERRIVADGRPADLKAHHPNPRVRQFFNRQPDALSAKANIIAIGE